MKGIRLRRCFSTVAAEIEREVMETDVLIVGAGPAGIAAAIQLKKLKPETNITVLEKGPYVGAQILSGAVIDPRGLQELGLFEEIYKANLLTPVQRDEFWLLSKGGRVKLPFIPKVMSNKGNYVASLSQVTTWLGEKAQALGVDVFPGFAASRLLFREDGGISGIITNYLGVRKTGEKGPNYQPGMEIRAPITLLAEGCHGHLSKQVIQKYKLREHHQTYGIGLKEVWQVPKDVIQPGTVLHSLGWPMRQDTYGGGFLYSFANSSDESTVNVAVGLVVGLDYRNPYLNPYQEFQRFKTHPRIKELFYRPNGVSKVVAYGARALTEGGWQSLPNLNFPGGALLGCAAGMVNVPRVKGSHYAIKSGMLAAECIAQNQLEAYDEKVRGSWIGEELQQVRNVRPGFAHLGFVGGLVQSAISVLSKGREPYTFNHDCPDHYLELASEHKPIEYPKPDGELTFDLLTSVSRTGTMHAEDQPSHLQLKDATVQTKVNLPWYAGPEQRFCPAGVYEYVPQDENGGDAKKFQINAQNCIHCKTCDIKDPSQNIDWTTPEGGGGPKYTIT